MKVTAKNRIFEAIFLIGMCAVFLTCPDVSPAAQVALGWDANTESTVAGYKLYYGLASRSYGTPIDVGKVTQYTFTKIQEGKTGYFAVTAYDQSGNESGFSNELVCYSLQPIASANGTINPNQTVIVSPDISRTFTITPASGYSIQDVLVDGASVGAVSTYTFSNVSSNHTISASFSANYVTQSHIIVAIAGSNGSISPSGSVSVTQGSSQQFDITPASGYSIQDVLVDGASVGAVSTYTFSNVSSNHTIAASFKLGDTFTIHATASKGGKILPQGDIQVKRGASQSFQFVPLADYELKFVLVNNKRLDLLSSYTFTNVTSDATIMAFFARPLKTSKKHTTKNPLVGAIGEFLDQPMILVGSGYHPGFGGVMDVMSVDGNRLSSVNLDWPEYNQLNGELRIATGDIDGDGKEEIVIGLAPVADMSGIPAGFFEILDDDYKPLAWGRVEWPEYNAINGETRPACGDLDGDGKAEIIVGLGPGGDGRMEVFTYENHAVHPVQWLSTGWQDYNRHNGETRPACGDLNGDGKAEIVAGLGPIQNVGFSPDGMYLIYGPFLSNQPEYANRKIEGSDLLGWGQIDWPAYNQANGESWPACGDITGEGKDEIVLGLGMQGMGRFEIIQFDIQKNEGHALAWGQTTVASYQKNGVETRPACRDLNGDGKAEVVLGFGKESGGFLEIFHDILSNPQSVRFLPYTFDKNRDKWMETWPAIKES